MGLKDESREILGHRYNVTQLGAIDGHKLFVELSPMLMEMAGPLSKTASGNLEETMAAALGVMAEAVRKYLPPERFIEIAKLLLGTAQCDDRKVLFEQDFGGENMAALYPVLLFALEVNYGSFLDDLGLRAVVDRMQASAETASADSLPI